MTQSTLQEFRTTLSPAEVLSRAKAFFPGRNSLYAAFLDQQGPSHATFRGLGGEEIAIAAVAQDGATRVTGSTYMFEAQIARFFTTLPAADMTDRALEAGA